MGKPKPNCLGHIFNFLILKKMPMKFTFTHSNKVGQIVFLATSQKAESFIKQAIASKFAPSRQTLQHIKSFAESLECKKTKSVGIISSILN